MSLARACLLTLLLAAVAHAGDEAPPRWVIGTLQGGLAAIGGETTGWSLDGLEVAADEALLADHDGERVAVFGRVRTRQGVERGAVQELVAEELLTLEGPEHDLVIQGRVSVPEVEAGLAGPLRVGALLQESQGGARPGVARDHLVVVEAGQGGAFSMTLPALRGERPQGLRLVAWLDRDRDGLRDAAEVGTWLNGADDRLNLGLVQGSWMTDGRGPMTVRSPWNVEGRLDLRPARRYLVRVLGPDGAPLKGAVDAWAQAGEGGREQRVTLPLDDEGRFLLALEHWDTPPVRLQVIASGYATAVLEGAALTASPLEVRLRREP